MKNSRDKLKEKVDKIDTIKTLLLKRAEHFESQLAKIREQIKRVEEVEAMLPSLGGIELDLPSPASVFGGVKPSPGKPYAGLSLTEAVKLALIHSAVSPVTLKQLREHLEQGGYPVPKSLFSEKLNATLYRLIGQGLVTSSEDAEGRKIFMRKI